jgi:hypothetical protein
MCRFEFDFGLSTALSSWTDKVNNIVNYVTQ